MSRSTTFRPDEVKVTTKLFEILLRGGDPSIVMRSKSIHSVIAKFQRMEGEIDGHEGQSDIRRQGNGST